MKVIIAGGRDFWDFDLLVSKCDAILKNIEVTEIVSGTANGADKLGEKYAELRGYKIMRFPADWEKHGKKAGIMRNKEMSVYADAAVIFWDGKSRGSKNMAENAQRDGLKLRIVRY